MKHKKFWGALWLFGVAICGIGLYMQWDWWEDYCKYYKRENWAYFAEGGEAKPVDLFLICPAVDTKDEFNMSLDDAEIRAKFLGALNMERGIYEENTRMYAPYYRQAALKAYGVSEEERAKYLKTAYKDIFMSFCYYMYNENKGRPFILAGFSQGADMCVRLVRDFLKDEKLRDKLVAVYSIGWPLDTELTQKYDYVKAAVSSNDTGVIISFECEAPDVAETFSYPENKKSHVINPLSWKVNEELADKSLNLGACFTDYDGKITREVKNFCGAYLDLNRGVVKIPDTDVDKNEYKAMLSFFQNGVYHIYDYLFFYRNLQENVNVRINAYLNNLKK